MMVVVIAMDAFKGCISSLDAAQEVKNGILSEVPDVEVRCLPVADGGEGTLDALSLGSGGSWKTVRTAGPLGKPVDAGYLVLSDGTALLELAAASGLPLLSEGERDPLRTTTYGTGELMKDALDHGCRNLFLGVGGSATNDGGAGLLEALGAQFLDAAGEVVRFGPVSSENPEQPVSVNGGGSLDRVVAVNLAGLHPAVHEMLLTVACDVTNPLCGSTGASHVFGPQKGATPEMVEQLDGNLLHYARVVTGLTGVDVSDMPGSGAAGGVDRILKLRRTGMSVAESMALVRERLRDAGARVARECLTPDLQCLTPVRCTPDTDGPMEA